MVIKTKCFGEIDITEDKIITFDKGLFGFEDFKQFTILYDNESASENRISWLQSVEEPALALPMINPFLVREDYRPSVAEESLKPLGNLTDENMAIYLVMSVPSDLSKMTANLKAPIVINSDNRKGAQLVAENQDYIVKYNIYDILANKEGKAC